MFESSLPAYCDALWFHPSFMQRTSFQYPLWLKLHGVYMPYFIHYQASRLVLYPGYSEQSSNKTVYASIPMTDYSQEGWSWVTWQLCSFDQESLYQFPSGHTTLHSHQQWVRVTCIYCPLWWRADRHSDSSEMESLHTSIYISLTAKGIEHFFIAIGHIHASFGNCVYLPLY